jgi:hypothetical protein
MSVKKKLPYLLLLLVMPLLGLIYTILNESPRKVTQIPLPIDHDIPFIVAFVVPYIFWYTFASKIQIYMYERLLPLFSAS